MTQSGTLKYLEKNREKWLTTREIIDGTKVNSAPDNLKKLYEQGEVLRKRVQIGHRYTYIWRIKDE